MDELDLGVQVGGAGLVVAVDLRCEAVQDADAVTAGEQQVDQVGTDETGAAGDQDA